MVVRLSFTLALVLLALVAVSMVAAVLLGQHTTTKVLDDDEATRDAALDICFAGGRKSSTAVTEDVLTAQVRAIKESTRLFLTETSGAVSMMVQVLSAAGGELLNSQHYVNTTWRALQAAAFLNARKRGSPIRELVSFRSMSLPASFFTIDLSSESNDFVVQVSAFGTDAFIPVIYGGMQRDGTIYPGECNFDAALAAGDPTIAGVCGKNVQLSEFVDGDGWLNVLTHDTENGSEGWWTTGTYPNMITPSISATSLSYFASFAADSTAETSPIFGKLVGGIAAHVDISRLSQSVLSTLQLRGQQRVYAVQIHPVTLSVDAIVVTSHGELDDPRGYLLNSKRDVVAADDAVIRAHGQFAMNYATWTEAGGEFYETHDGLCWQAIMNLPGTHTLDSCASMTRKNPRCLQEFVWELGGICYCVTGDTPCAKQHVVSAVYRLTDGGVELVGRQQELVCDQSVGMNLRSVELCAEAAAQHPECGGDLFSFRYDAFRSWMCTCSLRNATCTVRHRPAATVRTFMWSTPNTPAPDRAYERTYLRDPIGRKYTAMLNGAEWWVHQELLESDGVKLHVVALLESDEALREINQGVEDSKTLITAETAATRSSKDEAFLLHWLISAVLCVVFASFAVVLPGRMLRPLEALGTDMASVALLRTDDVDVKGPLSFFLEVRSMQSSFRMMHECIHAYRAFIPTAAIVDDDSDASAGKDDESSLSQLRKGSRVGSRSPTWVGDSGEFVERSVRASSSAESKQKYGTMLTSNRGGFLHMIREMDSQAMSAALCSMVELFVSTCTLHHGIVDVLQADHLSAHFGYLRQCATHRKAAAECASDLRPAASSDVVTLPIYCTCTSGIAWAGHFGSADTRRFMIIGGVASFSIVLERIATSRRFVVLVDKRVHDDIQTHWDCCARYNLRYPKRGSAAPVPVFEMMRRKVRKCGDGMCEWMYELGNTEANPWQAVNDAMEQWLGGHPEKALEKLAATGADAEAKSVCVQLGRQVEELGPIVTVVEADLVQMTKAEWVAQGGAAAASSASQVTDQAPPLDATVVWGQ